MKATRRRARRLDPLASPEAVARVLDTLRSTLPDLIPRQQKPLVSLLNSVRGLYSRGPAVGRRGRPPRHAREELLRVDEALRRILARETGISVPSLPGPTP